MKYSAIALSYFLLAGSCAFSDASYQHQKSLVRKALRGTKTRVLSDSIDSLESVESIDDSPDEDVSSDSLSSSDDRKLKGSSESVESIDDSPDDSPDSDSSSSPDDRKI